MTDIGKFFSDVDKLLKHTRQANSGKCDYDKVKKDLRILYDRAANCPTDFPSSLYEYWENEFIYNSPDLSNEPSQDNIGRLGAMVAFLNNSDEYSDLLSAKDWALSACRLQLYLSVVQQGWLQEQCARQSGILLCIRNRLHQLEGNNSCHLRSGLPHWTVES